VSLRRHINRGGQVKVLIAITQTEVLYGKENRRLY
jgi:hypothetical protein